MFYRIFLLLALFAPNLWAAAWFSPETDWSQAAQEAQERAVPILLLVTGDHCGYCKRMEQEFLSRSDVHRFLEKRAVTRELSREQGGKITDFDGERVRTRVFLERYGIFATPTLLLLSPLGTPLAPALVGYDDPESYAQRLKQRLARAQGQVEHRTPSPHLAVGALP